MTKKTVRDSELDPNFKFEIAKTYEGKTVLWCVQCGMCTSNCPYSDVLDVKPHQLIKMVLLGMREQAISCKSIWLCSTCFMCAETVPQKCHRLLLADYLWAQGIKVIHILDHGRTIVHELSRSATITGGRVIYNRPEPQQMELKPND